MKDLILYGLYTPVIFSKEVIPIKQLTNQFLKEKGKERDMCIYEYTHTHLPTNILHLAWKSIVIIVHGIPITFIKNSQLKYF